MRVSVMRWCIAKTDRAWLWLWCHHVVVWIDRVYWRQTGVLKGCIEREQSVCWKGVMRGHRCVCWTTDRAWLWSPHVVECIHRVYWSGVSECVMKGGMIMMISPCCCADNFVFRSSIVSFSINSLISNSSRSTSKWCKSSSTFKRPLVARWRHRSVKVAL